VGDDIAIFPMHPRTKKVYQKLNIKFNKNVKVVEPLSYHDLLTLLVNSRAVITDSGGVQKEAYWARIPCITLRDETEWVETVESGWNVLYKDYHNNKYFFDINRDHPSFHGDGNASERIVKLILKFINNKGF
jgi:UDP-GlcNAc3NAcA epimerase